MSEQIAVFLSGLDEAIHNEVHSFIMNIFQVEM